MKHVNYNLYENRSTVILTETKFYIRNQENFLFLFQNGQLLCSLGGSVGLT